MDKTILLFVDDEPELLNIYTKFFTSKNYSVFTALTGSEGLEIARKEKPHVVLLDIRMPGMEGIETWKKIRSFDQKVKAIMITGYGTAENIREVASLGVSDFVGKPFDLFDLWKTVKDCLEKDA